MSFDWKLYIDLSEELINHHKTPSLKDAYLRSAISRSYYGIFCIARERLIKETVYSSREAPHKEVRDYFNNAASRKEKQIGTKLGRLWQERKFADYDTCETFDDERARTAHKIAVDALDLLKKLNK